MSSGSQVLKGNAPIIGFGYVTAVCILTSHCYFADSDGVCLDIDGAALGDVTVDKTLQFSIWVSFYEIYNEFVYDLLETPTSLHTQKRNTLRLSDDKHGNVYVKGTPAHHQHN